MLIWVYAYVFTVLAMYNTFRLVGRFFLPVGHFYVSFQFNSGFVFEACRSTGVVSFIAIWDGLLSLVFFHYAHKMVSANIFFLLCAHLIFHFIIAIVFRNFHHSSSSKKQQQQQQNQFTRIVDCCEHLNMHEKWKVYQMAEVFGYFALQTVEWK